MFKKWSQRNKSGRKRRDDLLQQEATEIQANHSLNELVNALEERWTEPKDIAAHVLGHGYTVRWAAIAAKVNERTIYNWKHDPDFMDMVDEITVTTGLATKGERIREAKGIVREIKAWRKEQGKIPSEKDILDWLKYLRDEQEGLRLFSDEQLEQFAEALTAAGRGQDAVDGTGGAEADGETLEAEDTGTGD